MRNLLKIETARLTLVSCDLPVIEALFEGDEKLGAYLGVTVPPNWTEFGEPAFRWTYDRLSRPDADLRWWTYLPVLKDSNLLIGSCGFKGHPVDGMVEIGYEVAATHRGRGLATEIAGALIKFALSQPGITRVQAHTLAEKNESGTVLSKNGMTMVEEVLDPEDGKVWRWEIARQFTN